MIIGTAGHIDHGKTALVRALTGVDTDRLPEEKKRGITIELGFAPLTIPGVGVVSIVDVPGHEAFVRTMVAGAAGIDVALVVVAADEGVKPQTREHIAILDLLGVRAGVIALTKCDLVDTSRSNAVEHDVRRELEHTLLAGAPCVHVSAVSGAGIDALLDVLSMSARDFVDRARDDLTRLPVDRVFTKPGAGTVVTGTLWSGSIAIGDAVRVMPAGVTGRVRAVQTHGNAVERAAPANRVAVAVAGIATDEVNRGDTLVSDDAWMPTSVLRADVWLLPDARPLSARTRVQFHLGTADVGARIVCPGGVLAPGAARTARVMLDAPVVARGNDRFVLRRGSEGTIGGGVITDALPIGRRTRPFPRVEMTCAERLTQVLNEAGSAGTSVAALPVRLGGRRADWTVLLDSLTMVVTIGGNVVSRSVVDAAMDRIRGLVSAYHGQHPTSPGAPLDSVRTAARASVAVAEFAVESLSRAGQIEIIGAFVRQSGWTPKTDPDSDLCRSLLAKLQVAGAAAPPITELQQGFAKPVLPLLRRLEREGSVVALGADRFASAAAATALRESVKAGVRGDRGYRPSDLRSVFGLSRQYLIPWLEYFDRQGWSRRQGDERWFTV